MSQRPVCVQCRVEMRPQKNDVAAVEMDGDVQTAIWSADLWRCPDCGHEVVMGFGKQPITSNLQAVADRLTDMTDMREPWYGFWHSVEQRNSAESVQP